MLSASGCPWAPGSERKDGLSLVWTGALQLSPVPRAQSELRVRVVLPLWCCLWGGPGLPGLTVGPPHLVLLLASVRAVPAMCGPCSPLHSG